MKSWPSFILTNIKAWEITILLSLLAFVLGLWGFLELTDEILENEIFGYDEWVLNSLRRGGNPVGPPWMPEVMRDITSLGSTAVLVIVLASVSGFLALQKKFRSALLTIITAGSGVLVVIALKYFLARERPDIITHMVEVTSLSYPSGHAMMSAVVYLTLASMVALLQDHRRTKIYSIVMALLLTFLIGSSRVYLGVHYPSDVLAGWSMGLAWASLCWLVVRFTGWSDLLPVEDESDDDVPELNID